VFVRVCLGVCVRVRVRVRVRVCAHARAGLNAKDFGAVGDGVCTEAADRSWTNCTGRDDGPALQRAMDAALHQGRALYVNTTAAPKAKR